AAAEPVARRLAARSGGRAPDGRGADTRTARRRARDCGARALGKPRPVPRRPVLTWPKRTGSVRRPPGSPTSSPPRSYRGTPHTCETRSRRLCDSLPRPLGRPESAEVHAWISRLPAREEALDGRMEHDLVEFADREQAVAADCGVLRGHLLQRPAGKVAGEDDVHDVLACERARGRDRIDERDGPLEVDVLIQTDLFVQLAAECLYQALASVHAAAREQPVALVALLVAAQEHAVTPAQDGRDSDAGLAGHAPEDPKPAAPRCVSGS